MSAHRIDWAGVITNLAERLAGGQHDRWAVLQAAMERDGLRISRDALRRAASGSHKVRDPDVTLWISRQAVRNGVILAAFVPPIEKPAEVPPAQAPQ